MSDFWDPAWEFMLLDRSHSLETRLLRFYDDFLRRNFNDIWVRLFMHSALKRLEYHGHYVARVRERLYRPIAAELRFENGLPSFAEVPMTEFEVELIWALHATVFQLGQRRWVYHLPVPDDAAGAMAARVRSYIASAPAQVAGHLAALRSLKLASD